MTTTLARISAGLFLLASLTASAQELRFSWWGGGERHEAFLKAIKLFEQRNPSVKIKAEYGGFQGYQERLTTQIAGRSEPDIMQVNWAWLSAFSKQGEGFYDLRKAGSLINFGEFTENNLQLCTVNGKLNGLPVGFTARMFFWNKGALDKAGIAIPKTWDEMFAAGKALRAKLGNKAYLLDGENYDMILMSHAYTHQKFGTPYIDSKTGKVGMSAAALKEWVATYKRFQVENIATPLPLRASLGSAEKPTEQQPDWVAGNWTGNYTWDSLVRLRGSTLPGKGSELDIGEFLTLPGAKNSGVFGRPVHMYSLSKRTKHPEIGAKFLNFMMTDPDAIRILDMSRGIPATAIAYKQLLAENRLRPIEAKAYARISALASANAITPPAAVFEHPRVQKFMREVFEQVGYNKITVEEAAKRLAEDGNRLLGRI